MASRFPAESMVQLRTRKGHDRTWSCDKHDEPISFYCRVDKVTVCQKCAIKDHVKKQCELDDIEDVILERRRKLDDTQKKIDEEKKSLKKHASKIESSEASACNHLQSVNDEINTTSDRKLKDLKDKERREIRLINEEADEEIRIINEKRERRIRACREESEQRQLNIKDSEAKLISDMKTINEKIKNKLEELRSKNQHNIDIVDNTVSKIERIKQDDKSLVNEVPQLIALLDESLGSNVHQEVADYLDRIEREVQRVKFVECEVGGEHYGRIDGYIGKWGLVKSIDIPLIVNKPWVRGLISDDKIYILDSIDNAFCVTNISSEYTEKVIEGDSKMFVTSCALVDSNVVACGKRKEDCTGACLDGCITLYDRQWKVIRDITIPRNTSSPYHEVYVDVDRDGMILAVQSNQSNIYIINPADGKIVNTITMKSETVRGEIHALSSGDIVVKTASNVFTVISRSGEKKAVTHCDEWGWRTCCYVDELTYTLYVTYWDTKRKVYTVDQVSRDGNIQAKGIVEYKPSDRSHYRNPCLVTPSGNLVACDGDKLFLYKKSFIV